MPKKSALKLSASTSERRNHPRVAVNMWVREEREDYYYLFKAIDLSEGGFFLEKKIETPCPEIKSTFKFTLPKSSRIIHVTGGVAYSSLGKGKKPVGAGVKFDSLSKQDRKLIVKFINQNV